MNPQSHALTELFSARMSCPPHDDIAVAVLGPRLSSLWAGLGAPVRDWWRLSRSVDHLDDAQVSDALGGYLDVLVAQRCIRPGDDLVSDLIAHDVDGDGLTADEIRAVRVDFVQAAAQPV